MTETELPVNPLTGDLIPVRVYGKNTWTDAEGKLVTPGLAITRTADSDGPARFNLTHLGTGRAATLRRCGKHILDAAQLATEIGIDWTITDMDEITAAVKATSFAEDVKQRIGWMCDTHCVGDGPKPLVWSVSCSTCHWYSGDDGEEPFTAAEAKEVADEHRCEPEMSIRHPVTGKWHDPWLVNKDGTVRDLSLTQPAAVTL